MANQKLILEAEIRDSMSAKLREIQKELGKIGKTPGMESATGWLSKLGKEASDFTSKGLNAGEAINALGIGSLTAAASLAGMVAKMKELGEQSLALKELGRQLGMTADQVNQFSKAGGHFGVAGDAMQGMLNRFGAQIPEFSRNVGNMYKEMSGPKWAETLKRMQDDVKKGDIGDALLQAFAQADMIGKEKGPQAQKQFLDMLTGNGEEAEKLFSQGGYAGFIKEIQRMKNEVAPINPEMVKQAQDFRDSMNDFNIALENFENKAGPEFLRVMSDIVHTAKEVIDTISGGTDKGADKSKDGEDHRSIGQRLGDGIRDMGKLNDLVPGPDDLVKRAYRFGRGLYHKSSYDGSSTRNGLLQNASFIEGDSGNNAPPSSDLASIIAQGTKTGVLAAFRELSATADTSKAGNPLLTNASYGPDGSGGGLARGTSGGGGGPQGMSGDYPTSSSAGNLTKLIDEESKRAGIDPRILEGIRAGESGRSNKFDVGDLRDGGAYGPWQFNMGRGRFGDQFLKKTGLDPRDPKNIPAMTRYMAEFIAGKLKQNPNYASGGNASELHKVWHGFHGLTEANPRWGDSGYIPNGASGSDIGLHLRTLNEQCVSLANAAVGASGSVKEWRKGVGALEGTLKPGTPIATFLDRQGKASNRYAGGGIGTPGAHLDHAGVFQSYIRDKDGKIIGMNMAEQYKGSHGAHSKAYMFGSGWGEGNGSNYAAILGPDGKPLGGDRNPLNRQASGLHSPSMAGRVPNQPGGHVRADIHVHGPASEATVKSIGMVTASLKRWNTMTTPSDEA